MKIYSTQQMTRLNGLDQNASRGSKRGAEAGTPRDTVSLSSDAAFVHSLRAEAREPASIRPEVVAETRAALDAGTFESSVDLERMVDTLLADL